MYILMFVCVQVYGRMERVPLTSRSLTEQSAPAILELPEPAKYRLVADDLDHMELPEAWHCYAFPRGDPTRFPHARTDAQELLGTVESISLLRFT